MFTTRLPHYRPVFDIPQETGAAEIARRSNQRRLTVFLIVFSLTFFPGLAWNLLRPAEYRATAQVQINAGAVATQNETTTPGAHGSEPPGPRNDLLTQVQVLNSRPLHEEVMRRLAAEGYAAAFPGSEAIVDLQNVISVSPVAGTDIVEIQAAGRSPQLMARVVNTLIESYRDRLLASHGSASQVAIVNLRDEVERLGISIAEKRRQLDSFRLRSGVVSSERSENVALMRIKGLSESLNKAIEDATKAEARLRALRESTASGKSPVHSRDNPTLATIEQRISATREQLRDMERTYTADFMAMDPTARALRARLTELERQLTETRSASQLAALTTSEEEVAGTRATVERLRGQIEAQRREVQNFSGNFLEAQALESDLTRLEGTRRNAAERLARLEASENARLPTLRLIEAASIPQQPWRPDYVRDGLLNLLGSFVLGLLAMWFVELFNRSAPPPAGSATILVPQSSMAPALTMDASSPIFERRPGIEQQALPQLPAEAALPRELRQDEVAALLNGTEGEGYLLSAFFLLGLTVDELRQVSLGDIDLATSQLKVPGRSARTLELPEGVASALAKCTGEGPDKPVFCDSSGQAFSEAEITSRLACAALDAGLEMAASVTPETMRHTCIANLLRQNVRFSDLARFVGPLNTGELAAYAAVASRAPRVRSEDVDPIMPALRMAGSSRKIA